MMKQGFILRILLCVLAVAYFQYLYLQKQNQITKLRLEIPKITGELKQIKEENTRLQFEIDQFENPTHLMELARNEEFAHLKHPFLSDILTIHSQEIEQKPISVEKNLARRLPSFKPSLFVGAKSQ